MVAAMDASTLLAQPVAQFGATTVTLGQALRRLRPEEQEARVELLKEVARTWETGLADRAEALDAWKAVSAAAPEDSEASAALERLAAPR